MTPPKIDMKDRQIAELQVQRNQGHDDAVRHAAQYTDCLSTLNAERKEFAARLESLATTHAAQVTELEAKIAEKAKASRRRRKQ